MRRWIVPVLAAICLAVSASSAQAVYHLMKIREVHTGTSGYYVELQMYASGQNLVSGHSIRTYDGTGALLSTYNFTAPAGSGQNQRTILVASGPGIGATPDYTDASFNVQSGAGSVCFIDTPPSNGIDCVSYGAASPPTGNPSPVGTPAVALAQDQSLERSIARGCSTLLEDSDDTDDSAADFAIAAPSPRPNSAPPTETACGGGGGGGGGGDANPPETTITKGPKQKTEKTKAKFKFDSNESGSSFECKLDKKSFKPCQSPRKYKNLDPGKHKFQVRATDQAGNTDASPAKYKFKVLDK